MESVFITDAEQRKAIPIIRSLGKKGIEVTAGGTSRLSPSFFSKYCKRRVIYPSPKREPDDFINFLLKYLEKFPHKVLFAIDEGTCDLVTKYIKEFSKFTIVPLPPHKVYWKARDKGEALKLAIKLRITCPITYFPKNISEVKTLSKRLKVPLVIKPRLSSGSRGIAYVKSMDQLVSTYIKIHSQYPNPLIQEFIPNGGDTYGVEVLMNKESEPRVVFVHRRLREYPVNGGPSTLRESVDYPELAEMGVKILRALNWFGVAMVEFKIDPRDGIPKLMEINPKFWGSIQLPIVSGVDFPYLLYKLAVKGDVNPIKGYKIGVMCRWLLPGDILHFLFNKNRFNLNPSFFNFYDENIYYDILSKEDPGPVLGTVIYYLSKILSQKLLRDLTR